MKKIMCFIIVVAVIFGTTTWGFASTKDENTINSIDELTSAEFDLETEQETGEIRFSLHRPASDDADLLIQSLILGLKGIQKDYGDEYLVLDFKEV